MLVVAPLSSQEVRVPLRMFLLPQSFLNFHLAARASPPLSAPTEPTELSVIFQMGHRPMSESNNLLSLSLLHETQMPPRAAVEKRVSKKNIPGYQVQ